MPEDCATTELAECGVLLHVQAAPSAAAFPVNTI